MPLHRVSFEFRATVGVLPTSGSTAGWTESWYDTSNLLRGNAVLKAVALSQRRRQLLTSGWSLVSIRVSELSASFTPLRRSTLTYLPVGSQPGTYGAAQANLDEQPYDAVEIAIACFGGHSRNFQMRGIGQDVINAGGRFLNPANWVASFPGWRDFLNGINQVPLINGPGDPYAVRFRTIIGERVPILAVFIGGAGSPAVASPQVPVLDVQGGIAINPGDFLVIQGSTGISRLNGTWDVVDRAVNGDGSQRLQLGPKRRVVLAGTVVLRGYVTGYRYGLDVITLMTPGFGTSRRTGRPSQVTRGRRSNRA